MASSIISDNASFLTQWPLIIHVVSNVTVIISFLTLIIFVYVIILRILNILREKQKNKFKLKWRKVIFNWMTGDKIKPVPLHLRKKMLLLELWLKMRRLIEDASANELNEFAIAFRLDDTAASILQYRSYNSENKKIWLQLLAVKAARYMHTDTSVHALLRASNSHNFRVNIAATCALVELNHEQADLAVLSSIMQFSHWVPFIVVKVSQAGGSHLLHLIGGQMNILDDEQARNLISLTESSFDRSMLPLLINILVKNKDIQEQASILKTLGRLGDSSHIKYVIPYLNHESPVLRLRAVTTLGQLGGANELKSIFPLVSDEEWWVRYRAAESYLLIAKPTKTEFNNLIGSIKDKPAKEMFRHVFTELGYA